MMTRNTWRILLIAASLFSLCVAAYSQSPVFLTQMPSTKATAFAQDRDGYIWIGTANGLIRYNGTGYAMFLSDGSEGSIINDNILSLLVDSEGTLWVGTECGFFSYSGGKFSFPRETQYNPMTRILELNSGQVLLMGERGLLSFNKKGSFSNGADYPYRFSEQGCSSLGRQVTVTSGGDVVYVRNLNSSKELVVLDNTLSPKKRVAMKETGGTVIDLCELSGIIYVATEEGLCCFDSSSYEPIPIPGSLRTLIGDACPVFMKTNGLGELVVGLSGKGVFAWSHANGSGKRVLAEQTLPGKGYDLFIDGDNDIMLSSSSGDLLFFQSNALCRNLYPNVGESTISSLFSGPDGNLWILADDVVKAVSPVTGEVLYSSSPEVRYKLLSVDRSGSVWTVSSENNITESRIFRDNLIPEWSHDFDEDILSLGGDNFGNMFVLGSSGLKSISPSHAITREDGPPPATPVSKLCSDPVRGRVFFLPLDKGLIELMPDKTLNRIGLGNPEFGVVNCLATTSNGSIWAGTYNDGVTFYDGYTGKIRRFTTEDGLISNSIKSIAVDPSGNVWIASISHIMRYDPLTGTFSVIHDGRYTHGHSYSISSVSVSSGGEVFFGGSYGISKVPKSVIIPNDPGGKFLFEEISAGNHSYPVDTTSLVLNHKENSLSLRFASIDYRFGDLLSYSYKLDGFDDDWINLSGSPHVVYSFLPPGRYTFRARVRNLNGEWRKEELSLPIRIKPSPMASLMAKLLYLLLAAAAIYSVIRASTRMRVQKERLQLSLKREEMDRQHIDFLTNISHEFRTPLTMIYAPAKELSSSASVSGKDRALAETIGRNAERLRTLSEQILSNATSHKDVEELHIRQNDLSSVLRSVAGNYSYAISEKGQSLELDIPQASVCFFDTDKVVKIVGNLLSNAVKYTEEGGHLKLSLSVSGDSASISVRDNGIGVDPKKKEDIFGRFNRLGRESSGIVGSGIGLNYALRLSRLHNGDLVYEPAPDKGSVFTLRIPVGESSYEGEVVIRSEGSDVPSAVTTPENAVKKGSVLVVEDNDEIREFLRMILSESYDVQTAFDGLEAEDNLKLALPDLVLSDVIMPNKDGFELCRDLKENSQTCHIPVVLLTAKADSESNVGGMKAGADVYLPKPFDPEVLKATIESVIDNRRKIQGQVLNLTSSSMKKTDDEGEHSFLSSKDRSLLKKIHSIVDEHLSNPDFSVQDISDQLGISYSNLYSKMKGLTGKTPINYINTYRMNVAKELLKEGELTISEISYKIGFSSPFSFTREFKKQFGIPPSDYLKSSG